MKRFLELLATPISGLMSAPLVLAIYALYALMFHIGYNELVQPFAALYGHILPAVPYWHWIVVITIIAILKYAIMPTRVNDPKDKELVWKNGLSRIAGIFGCIFLSFLINWIWL